MDQRIVDAFIDRKPDLRSQFAAERPGSYEAIVRAVVEAVNSKREWDKLDLSRMQVIDHGHYQGTQLFVIPEEGYQPSTYWTVFVHYGSCSGCDSLEAARGWEDEITSEEVDKYMLLALHIAQGLKKLEA